MAKRALPMWTGLAAAILMAAAVGADEVPVIGPRTGHRKSGRTLPVRAVAVSADGRFAAGMVEGGSHAVVDVASGAILLRLPDLGRAPRFAFAPDGSALAACSFTTLSLIDLPKGRRRFRIETGDTNREGVAAVAFSSDGERVATAGAKTRIFDAGNGKPIREIPFAPLNLGFALDDRILVTARSTTVLGWDVETGEEVYRHAEEYHSVCGNRRGQHPFRVSPDGRTLLSIGETGIPRHIEAATGREIVTFQTEKTIACQIEFLPGADRVATVTLDNRLRIFNAWTGRMVGSPRSLGLSEIEGDLLSTGGKEDRVIAGRDILVEGPAILRGHSSRVNALAFSHDGVRLISGGWDRRVFAWTVEAPNYRGTLQGAAGWIHDLDYSPVGGLLAACDEGGKVLVWRFMRWGLASTNPAVNVPVARMCRGVDFTPDGKHLVTAGADGVIRLWSIPLDLSEENTRYYKTVEAAEVTSLPAHSDEATHVAISADGTRLASAGWDRKVRLFRMGATDPIIDGSQEGETFHLENVPVALTFAGTGSNLRLLALDSGGVLHRWTSDTTKAPLRLGIKVAVATFSQDGSWLAVAGGDPDVVLFDVASGKRRAVLRGHEAPARCLAFAPDGNSLASGGSDDVILFWDLTGLADPAEGPDAPGDLASLWRELGSEDTAEAYAAMDRLRHAGDETVALIRQGLAVAEDIPWVLDGEPVAAIRALQVLEAMGTPAAATLLDDLARDGDRPGLAAAAASSLARLQRGTAR